MNVQVIASPKDFTVADLLKLFGPIALRRIRQDPLPGTATEEDVLAIYEREQRLYELVDGILVEKAMGFTESFLACALIEMLRRFVVPKKLGIVVGESAMMRLAPGLIRIPDVSFIAWEKLPNRRLPKEAIPHLFPDLAIEVLSKSNTPKEMDRKLRDYFKVGVRLVWLIDPRKRNARVYTSLRKPLLVGRDGILDGGAVLPGFSLSLRELFAELD